MGLFEQARQNADLKIKRKKLCDYINKKEDLEHELYDYDCYSRLSDYRKEYLINTISILDGRIFILNELLGEDFEYPKHGCYLLDDFISDSYSIKEISTEYIDKCGYKYRYSLHRLVITLQSGEVRYLPLLVQPWIGPFFNSSHVAVYPIIIGGEKIYRFGEADVLSALLHKYPEPSKKDVDHFLAIWNTSLRSLRIDDQQLFFQN